MTEAKKNTPPLKPTALMNFKKTDDELAKIIGNFWKLTWNKKNPAIDQKTKYLLSLANAVGAVCYRQATRELVKTYADGVTVPEFNELFSLFVWNQGAGHFASEIAPSQLFSAYQLIKTLEREGQPRTIGSSLLCVGKSRSFDRITGSSGWLGMGTAAG